MRIDSITLKWFRGAAESVAIRPDGKSMVVYGENGSGKSSFVDAIEFILHDGWIGHLAHEYSGKHQERGVLNTDTPKGCEAELRIRFADKSEHVTAISKMGVATSSGADATAIRTWDYRQTVLRQNEVSAFIQDTKGNKYSALLPLLGLRHLEVAAENLRQLRKAVEQESNLSAAQSELDALEEKRRKTLGEASDAVIVERMKALHAKYCGVSEPAGDPTNSCSEVEQALAARIDGFTVEEKQRLLLEAVAGIRLRDKIQALRSCSSLLAVAAEPLLTERLEVLETAASYAAKIGPTGEVSCPACGLQVQVDELRAHVERERGRLHDSLAAVTAIKKARGRVCDSLIELKRNLGTDEAKSWRAKVREANLVDGFNVIDGVNADDLRAHCSEDDLRLLEEKILPLIGAASAQKGAAPDMRNLLADRAANEAGGAVISGAPLRERTLRTKALLSFLLALEEGVRAEIRLRAQAVIEMLSKDIQRMWAILHPGEAVEDIRLCVPEDADKAIDVQLRFHGVMQESPRLTLSEGYRNSLGLCIFLAMAKRVTGTDRPLLLDDVVVSLDRNHRGMIVELLEKEFSGRQVLLFTHEREWYSELRQQLKDPEWKFTALMPYDKPAVGIRVSGAGEATFADARAHLDAQTHSAGNTARTIMDIELAVRAPRLKLRLPYLHREKNDQRMAHEFLSRIISDGAKSFQIDESALVMYASETPNVVRKGYDEVKYVPHSKAIEAFREADRLVVSWGNRASHTFDIVRSEAEKLIAACEAALAFFDCPRCKKPVYKTDDATGEYVQCSCGTVRWRYGKA
jgi:energy-coupling factor transporter ATP-binding protein EcfA2